MIDEYLLDELEAAAARIGSVTRMDDASQDQLVAEVFERYVAQQTSVFWWEWLKVPEDRFSYGNADGLQVLAKLVEPFGEAFLIVSAEELPPWPVFSGTTKALIALLAECPFCEYALVASDLSRIVFDTHHNELIVAPAGTAFKR